MNGCVYCMLKTKTKKKKKFKIVSPIKEAQIIDYIPEKKKMMKS